MPFNSVLQFYYEQQGDVTNYYLQPFTIHILEDETKVSVTGTCHFKYSWDDGITWHSVDLINTNNTYVPGPHGTTSTYFNTGERMIIVGTVAGPTNYTIKTNNKTFNVSGNIMSLYGSYNGIDYTNTESFNNVNFSFQNLLEGSYVVDASKLVLPVTKLSSSYTYAYMFKNCTYLKKAPALPATTLAQYSYYHMFYGCTQLEECPELPATALKAYCYYEMFRGCTSLRMPCQLPATTMAGYCYDGMFRGCTSLLQMPNLPATSLSVNCYEHMFNGCTSLTIAKELPATALANYCYSYMFYACTSLMRAPDLEAATLTNYCYDHMFMGCTSLNYIRCLATSKQSSSLTNWVYNVAPSGTFVKDINAVTDMESLGLWFWKVDDVNGIPIGWTIQNDGTAEVSGVSISISVDPSGSGLTYGQGSYTIGDTCTITASPDSGYAFAGWYVGDSLLSSSITYSFTVSASLDITAKFEVYEITYYTVRWCKTYDNTINWSEITQYAEGTQVTINAPEWPTTGGNYIVSGWYEKAPNASEWTDLETDDYSYTFTVTQDIDILIRYEYVADEDANIIKMGAAPSGYGQYNISYTGTSETRSDYKAFNIPAGTLVTITAIPNVGYEFDYWQLDGIQYSTSTSITLTPTQDFYLTAIFKTPAVNYRYENFTIQSLEPNCGVWINIYKGEHFKLQYSKNYEQWQEIELQYDAKNTIQNPYFGLTFMNSQLIAILQTGGHIRLRARRGILEPSNYASDEYGDPKVRNRFNVTQKYIVKGNLYSLVDWTDGHDAYVEPAGTLTVKDNAFAYMFWGDENLMSSENLNTYHENAGKRSFFNMFAGCSNMTDTMSSISGYGTNGESCYAEMYMGCSSITKAPLLTARLAPYIFSNMFYGCSKLNEFRQLSLIGTLAEGCYAGMFAYCGGLLHAPALPVMEMAKLAYFCMFQGCAMLQEAPELPATILAEGCYEGMFQGCKSLNFAPVLPATTLANGCYSGMFDGCNNLCYIKILSTDTDYAEKMALNGWTGTNSISTVALKGNFIKASSMTYPLDNISGVPVGWTVYDSGAQDEPAPELVVDKVLIKEQTLENLTSEEQEGLWFDDGAPDYTDIVATQTWSSQGCTVDVIQGGHGYLPQWMPLACDDTVTMQQGHNYKVTIYCKISNVSPDYNTLTCSIGGDGSRMYENFYIGDTNDEYVDITFDFPNFHDNDHTDPDDAVGPAIFLQFPWFRGTISVKDVKLYEYGIDAGEQGTNYAINVQYNEIQGNVSGAGYYAANANVTLTATPKTGYKFMHWIKDGVILGTSSTLTITALDNATYQAIFEVDTEESSDYANRYLTIEAVDDALYIYFGGTLDAGGYPGTNRYGDAFTLYYSIENRSWQSIEIPAITNESHQSGGSYAEQGYRFVCTLYRGQNIRFHANAATLNTRFSPSLSYTSTRNRKFYITGKFNVYGNILSLVDTDLIMTTSPNHDHPIQPDFSNVTLQGSGNFAQLFYNTYVKDASNLILPTTLTESIFSNMFAQCRSLTTAPALPATTLVAFCYSTMFYNCSSLNNIRCLATDISAFECTNRWVDGVSTIGSFTKPASMNSWTTGENGIPSGWVTIDA